jgi:hypothetical protein
MKLFGLIMIGSLCFSQHALAGGLPYLVGTEAAVEATSQAFASPPLPSLDGDGRRITPMFGIVTIEGVDDSSDYQSGSNHSVYDGQVHAKLESLSYSSTGRGDLGYFVILSGTQVTGAMNSTDSEGTYKVTDIASSGYMATAGASYRLIGSDKSIFALGLFGGPGYMSVAATETVLQPIAIQPGHPQVNVSFNSDFYGLYYGMQFLFRVGQFRINPYLATFADTSPRCRKNLSIQGTASITSLCESGEEGFGVSGSLWAVGLNLGYGGFSLNVYSQAFTVTRYLKASSYNLSYSFHF